MPGFDFSKSELEDWKTPIPNGSLGLHIEKASWDHGKFVVEVTSVFSDDVLSPQFWHSFSISCEPTFVVMIADEAMGINLWQRCSEVGLVCGGHLIVTNSDWVSSFKQHEAYGYSYQKGEAVHYVLCASDDFVHIVSKKPPVFKDLGIVPASNTNPVPKASFTVLRSYETLNPVQKLLSNLFYGRRKN
jgi:hypothetical protein